jgi:hypothetical protein
LIFIWACLFEVVVPCIFYRYKWCSAGPDFSLQDFQYRARIDGWAEILGADAKNVNANIWQSQDQAAHGRAA